MNHKSLYALSLDPKDLQTNFEKSYLEKVDVLEIRRLEHSTTLSHTLVLHKELIRCVNKTLFRIGDISKSVSFLLHTGIQPWMIDIPYSSLYPDEILARIFEIRTLFPQSLIQLSYHSPQEQEGCGEQNEVCEIISILEQFPVDAIKCAIYPKTVLVSLKMLQILKNRKDVGHGTRLTLIAMGEKYSFTRLLGCFFGNFLTFTCLPGMPKASGQIDIDTCVNRYRLQEITELQSIYALIGNPVDKSLSDITHTSILHTVFQKPTSIYVKIQLDPEEVTDAFFDSVRKLSFRGFSVTTPLKKEVIKWGDPKNKTIPMNTVFLDNEGLRFINTDTEALYKALLERKSIHSIQRIAVLGCGDVAISLFHFLQERGISVDIYSRNPPRNMSYVLPYSAVISEKKEYDVVINTTSDREGRTLIQLFPPEYIPTTAIVAEFIYPERSAWLQEIEKRRLSLNGMKSYIITGLELWMKQAALQFCFWYEKEMGRSFPDYTRLESKIRDIVLSSPTSHKLKE